MEMLTELLSYYEILKTDYRQEDFVELLREIQEIYGCITPEMQALVSEELHIGLPVIRTIIKQYSSLKEQPARHVITVCTGRNCHDKGCAKLLKAIEKEIGTGAGETTRDGRFHVQTRCCLKSCKTAPNIKINDDLYTSITPRGLSSILGKYH